eukprot:617330-Pleurochrysis_carterae.AAC.2
MLPACVRASLRACCRPVRLRNDMHAVALARPQARSRTHHVLLHTVRAHNLCANRMQKSMHVYGRRKRLYVHTCLCLQVRVRVRTREV